MTDITVKPDLQQFSSDKVDRVLIIIESNEPENGFQKSSFDIELQIKADLFR
jgi:hypothetical protein